MSVFISNTNPHQGFFSFDVTNSQNKDSNNSYSIFAAVFCCATERKKSFSKVLSRSNPRNPSKEINPPIPVDTFALPSTKPTQRKT